ncbi:5-oxoprolinase subunit PxpB [Bacillus ndiopicus]|uniref:5-oxoprolinase subunit PxpB n=1 Tax=Bacillus ndiopicus TaxID=1347368 RepID=UPI0005A9B3E0|nr:5-oxoprolinase subunit PxpB [Bacillus ndiopicus]
MFKHITFKPLNDCALLVVFGDSISITTHQEIQQFHKIIEQQPFQGMIEAVPSYTSICIYYDIVKVSNSPLRKHSLSIYECIVTYLQKLLQKNEQFYVQTSRLIEIPVIYGGQFGPDLPFVAEYHQLSEEEIIERHTAQEYIVYMLGFAPGFAFLGGLDETIATPRKEVPRLAIPTGSVGIGGQQTGVYPFETPGGWQIIGRTPQALFLPDKYPPTYLQAGDRVRFKAISEQQWRDFK